MYISNLYIICGAVLKTVYTINGFSSLLATFPLFQEQETQEKKLLLLDRCNWLITRIAIINIFRNEPVYNYVNLHSVYLKKYLTGRNYIYIENCLIDLGIIQKNDGYATNRFSKSFRLTDKAVDSGIAETTILSKKFNSKIEEQNNKRIEEILSNPLLKKIAINTSRLKVIEEEGFLLDAYYNPLDYIEKDEYDAMSDEEHEKFYAELMSKLSKDKNHLFKVMRYEQYYRGFKSLNDIDDPEQLLKLYVNYKPSVANTGRIYHTFASMPKQVRKCLRTKNNELIWEIDMSSAQPSIMFLEWLKWAKNNFNNKFKDEYELCLKLLLDSGIYKYIENNSEYFKGLKYDKLKESVLTVINAEYIPTKQEIELSKLFPNVFKWINKIKKVDHKKVSYIGQRAEAQIFVESYKDIPDNKFALIIHDCILVTKQDLKLVRGLLETRIRKMYPEVILSNHNLDKLFKEELVSIPDDNLIENKLNKFYKKVTSGDNRKGTEPDFSF